MKEEGRLVRYLDATSKETLMEAINRLERDLGKVNWKRIEIHPFGKPDQFGSTTYAVVFKKRKRKKKKEKTETRIGDFFDYFRDYLFGVVWFIILVVPLLTIVSYYLLIAFIREIIKCIKRKRGYIRIKGGHIPQEWPEYGKQESLETVCSICGCRLWIEWRMRGASTGTEMSEINKEGRKRIFQLDCWKKK